MFALCIESSHKRGMGHFYRALNLANALEKAGYPCKFYLNDHAPSLKILVEKALLHEIINLEDFDSDWEADVIQKDNIKLWLNDRLDTDFRHAKKIKNRGMPLVTFDDRGTGACLCDLHIAALSFDGNEKLQGAKLLRGADFLILNPKISDYKRVRKRLSSILVTLGGSDTYGVTLEVAKILKKMKRVATIVVGPAFRDLEGLESILTEGFLLKRDVPSMIEEFYHHDLAITGGGITPFEANSSGLPCIVIANELFEIPVGKELQKIGGSFFAGYYKELRSPLFEEDLPLEQMSYAGTSKIALKGTQRVVDAILELIR